VDLSLNHGTLVVTGGPGHSPQTAIVIRKTPRGLSAAGAEHLLLEHQYGRRNHGWTLESCELVQEGGRTYDVYSIKLGGGGMRTLYFDVTDWLTLMKQSL
jgi:hypothetical protein